MPPSPSKLASELRRASLLPSPHRISGSGDNATVMHPTPISIAFQPLLSLQPRHLRISNPSILTGYPLSVSPRTCPAPAPPGQAGLTAAHPLTSKYPVPRPSPPPHLSPLHFLNLTNGIEALPTLSHLHSPSTLRFTRIQSSHCESGCYDKLLAALDTELLFALACGRPCYVYDFASRNKARGVSRALFLGLEFIKWSLEYLWVAGGAGTVMVRGKNVAPFWREEVMKRRVSKEVKKRVRYFEPFAREMGISQVKLYGVYGRVTEIDGCKEVHVRMVRDWLEAENRDAERNEGGASRAEVAEWIMTIGYAEFHSESTEDELRDIQEWMKQHDGASQHGLL